MTSNLTPREIVSELDRYIVGQNEAKRSVAIALRNRWRRQQVDQPMRDEIVPKNIIMIGSTGVGKTEIARRLAKLANAPFVKVEASKFTEVGYIGKDVESMIRDLTDTAIKMVRVDEEKRVKVRAQELAEERLLDLLLPKSEPTLEDNEEELSRQSESEKITREKMRKMLRNGELNERRVEFDMTPKPGQMPPIEVVAATSVEDMSSNLRDLFSNMMPQGKKKRELKVLDAMEMLEQEEAAKLIDMEDVSAKAINLVEQSGIVFLDEIDKIASGQGDAKSGPDISREGVQRDILPIIEGSTVNTKYGMVKTDHVLFVAAGAFHSAKPSDLIPELQGRFPIRVELNSLNKDDFFRILKEPENSLPKQYTAMMNAEGVKLKFSEDALQEICEIAAEVNAQTEDIGARRLHTVMEKLLEDISFGAPEWSSDGLEVNQVYVREHLAKIVKDRDLSRYVL